MTLSRIVRNGRTEITYQVFEDGTVRIVPADPVRVPRSKWHCDKIHVLFCTPVPSQDLEVGHRGKEEEARMKS